MNKSVELRNALKKRKPIFRRQDSHKKKTLSPSWRKPKGSDSKMRVKKRGYCKSVTKGYKSPKLAKGLTRNGFILVNVSNLSDLKKIENNKTQIANILSTVGLKNRMLILEEAIKQNIGVFNYKDSKKKLNEFNDLISKKKDLKAKLSKEKEDKLKEKEKVAQKKAEKEKKEKEKSTKEKKSIDEIAQEEKEKKEEEKKERDKLLIKKDN
jgi:large subunit ribosomal protein L32e